MNNDELTQFLRPVLRYPAAAGEVVSAFDYLEEGEPFEPLQQNRLTEMVAIYVALIKVGSVPEGAPSAIVRQLTRSGVLSRPVAREVGRALLWVADYKGEDAKRVVESYADYLDGYSEFAASRQQQEAQQRPQDPSTSTPTRPSWWSCLRRLGQVVGRFLRREHGSCA